MTCQVGAPPRPLLDRGVWEAFLRRWYRLNCEPSKARINRRKEDRVKNPKQVVLIAVTLVAATLVFCIVLLSQRETADSGQAAAAIRERIESAPAQEPQSLAAQSVAIHSAVAEQGTRKQGDWTRAFGGSRDYSDFVATAAAAALAGDGRAAYYIRNALNRCNPVIALFKRKEKEPEFDPEAEYINASSKLVYPPVQPREDRVALFARCHRLAEGNAFANLPIMKEDGYSPDYWDRLSLTLNDPLAAADRVGVERAKLAKLPESERRDALAHINRLTQIALVSKDPQALFTLGLNSNAFLDLVDAKNTDSKRLGLALAACELGADCVFSHLGFQMWRNSVNVSDISNLPFGDAMREMVGSDRFLRAYDDAQQFKEMWARGDWKGIAESIDSEG